MIRISKETSHTLGSKPKPETTIVTQFLVYLSCLPPRGKTPVRGDSPVHPTGPRLWSTPILRRESSHPKVHRELGKQVLVLYTPTRRRKSGGCPTTGHGCRESPTVLGRGHHPTTRGLKGPWSTREQEPKPGLRSGTRGGSLKERGPDRSGVATDKEGSRRAFRATTAERRVDQTPAAEVETQTEGRSLGTN